MTIKCFNNLAILTTCKEQTDSLDFATVANEFADKHNERSHNWNKMDPNIQKSSSLEIYKRALLKFIRPTSANVYKIHYPRGLKLLTRLRLGLSHLREHKFRHNFNDTIDPFCLCSTNSLETTEHFLLICPIYASFRLNLFDNLRNNNLDLFPSVNGGHPSFVLVLC